VVNHRTDGRQVAKLQTELLFSMDRSPGWYCGVAQ